MEKWTRLDLELVTGHRIHMNNDYLEPYKEDLLLFLEDKDYMNNIDFAKNMMMSQEIKSNNTIEGINNDLTIIDEVIDKVKVPLSTAEKKRIINLYHGYQYILTHRQIDKEHLKELYSILSNGILEPYNVTYMGEYYRTRPVYILKGNNLSVEPFTGVDADKIDYYMNQFFEYVNDNSKNEQGIDAFIKSQVMHFYFVYIHPYFDVNGRTSRTVAMSYLLGKEAYPYIIFNRAIAFNQKEYEPNIIKARDFGDVTLFLKYMLVNVQKELEKEHIINNIATNINGGLTKEEHQMIEYFFNINGNLTIKELATMYNTYNDRRPIMDIKEDKIMPLIDKRILIIDGYTQHKISNDQYNMWLKINPKVIDVDKNKVKHLQLNRFIK